jgi:two-component system cell cycle response regulator
MGDIDHFKRINDTYGHDVGDLVLREFAERFRYNTRGIDLVCRLGGEEFVLVMPDVDPHAARSIAERLCRRIAEQPFAISPGHAVSITASVGLSTVVGGEDTPDRIFKRADNALYTAKRDGRNRVVSDAA